MRTLYKRFDKHSRALITKSPLRVIRQQELEKLSGSVTRAEDIPAEELGKTKKYPTIIQEVGNLAGLCLQHWVTKNATVEIFPSESEYRHGFVVKNNGLWKIYIGFTETVTILKQVGFPLEPKESFSSALFQGRLWCVADDTATTNSVDVRVWEEQY